MPNIMLAAVVDEKLERLKFHVTVIGHALKWHCLQAPRQRHPASFASPKPWLLPTPNPPAIQTGCQDPPFLLKPPDPHEDE